MEDQIGNRSKKNVRPNSKADQIWKKIKANGWVIYNFFFILSSIDITPAHPFKEDKIYQWSI